MSDKENDILDKEESSLGTEATDEKEVNDEMFGLLYAGEQDTTSLSSTDTALGIGFGMPARSGMKRVYHWDWAPFANSARPDKVAFHHWKPAYEEAGDYYFAKFNKQVNIPEYTEAEYNAILRNTNVNWNKAQTDHLIDLAKRFDLRFIVMADRWDRGSYGPKSVEDLKERYYEVVALLAEHKSPDSKERPFFYDAEYERTRKEQLNKLYKRTKAEEEEEQMLIEELQSIKERKKERERKEQLRKLHEISTGQVTEDPKRERSEPLIKMFERATEKVIVEPILSVSMSTIEALKEDRKCMERLTQLIKRTPVRASPKGPHMMMGDQIQAAELFRKEREQKQNRVPTLAELLYRERLQQQKDRKEREQQPRDVSKRMPHLAEFLHKERQQQQSDLKEREQQERVFSKRMPHLAEKREQQEGDLPKPMLQGEQQDDIASKQIDQQSSCSMNDDSEVDSSDVDSFDDIEFALIRDTRVTLQSKKIKVPINNSQRRALKLAMEEFKVDPAPPPTTEIVHSFNDLRTDLIHLTDLRTDFSTAMHEIECLKEQYEIARPGMSLNIPSALTLVETTEESSSD